MDEKNSDQKPKLSTKMLVKTIDYPTSDTKM